jgi:hypothetical protein
MKIINDNGQKVLGIDKRDGIYLSILLAFMAYNGVPSSTHTTTINHIQGDTYVYNQLPPSRSLIGANARQGIPPKVDEEKKDEQLCYGAKCKQSEQTQEETQKEKQREEEETPTPVKPPVHVPRVKDTEGDTIVEPTVIVEPPEEEEKQPNIPIIIPPGTDTGVTEDEITPDEDKGDDGLPKAKVKIRLKSR